MVMDWKGRFRGWWGGMRETLCSPRGGVDRGWGQAGRRSSRGQAEAGMKSKAGMEGRKEIEGPLPKSQPSVATLRPW